MLISATVVPARLGLATPSSLATSMIAFPLAAAQSTTSVRRQIGPLLSFAIGSGKPPWRFCRQLATAWRAVPSKSATSDRPTSSSSLIPYASLEGYEVNPETLPHIVKDLRTLLILS